MNIVFMGTPEFAVPSLVALIENGYAVAAVVTQPDRPKGRKRILTPPPVKVEAEARGIPVMQPEKLRNPAAIAELSHYAPDLIVTAAYGQILPKAVLDMPRLGCINVHGSLLPKYRGAAPIQYAIMNGETETGVTLMYMEEGLDTGAMISAFRVPIEDEDDTGTLFDKLSLAGANLLLEAMPDLIAGRIAAVPQNDAEATYAPMLKREHERIDWSLSPAAVFNQVRALRPWPGAFTTIEGSGELLKIWRCGKSRPSGSTLRDEARDAAPGTVIALTKEGIEVSCGDGSIIVTELQPAGKTAMKAAEFGKSGRLRPGDRLGGEASN